ncbi:reverse transcriptase domain-containing protein [Tanacetum coccineum]
MSSITTKKSKLDLKLVPKEKRLKIGKCNGGINLGKKEREPTFQVVLDALALALTPCYSAFLITVDVPKLSEFPRSLMVKNFDATYHDEDLVSFYRTWSYRNSDNPPILLLIRCINLGELLPLSSTEAYLERQLVLTSFIFLELKYFGMRESKAYKTYLGYATGATPPKKAQTFKKPASPQLTTVPVSPEEPTRKSKRIKRPKEKMTVEKCKGIDLLSEVALTEEARYKEVRKKSLRNFHKTHPSGSDTVTKTALSAAKIKHFVSNEGTSDEDDSNNEHDSRSEGSDQERDSGDDKAQFDSEKGSDSEHETVENESGFEYDQEENEEEIEDDEEEEEDAVFDDDVNVRLNEPVETDEGFIHKQGTDAKMTNVQQGNENPEIALNQVIEDAHVTLYTVPCVISLLLSGLGYGEAIVLPEINADHFEIKTNLLQLVQANPFYGRESENPHAHINSFKRITSTLRFRNVPNDVIKLMMFPYSLEGAAKTWYEKEPPNSILTWEDLVTKFVNQFFPPSKTTHLKNEISRFTQKFEETFSEAWERFKELLRACPHHGFTKLTQVDTFYNGLNENEQDSLNAAAGGNLLSKTTREALNIIENKSKVRYSRNRSNASRMNATSSKTDERIDKLADQLSTLVEIVSKKVVTPALVKAVEETCVTCGGAHSWYNCPATDNNQASVCATTGTYNQVNPPNRVSNQMAPPGFAPVQNNGQNRFNQNQVQGNNFRGNNFHGNQAQLSCTLPSNTIPNPKGEMKAITTRSGVAYEGPSIPTNPSPKKVVERETEETTDKEQTNFQGSTAQIPPPVIPISILEPDVPKTLPKTTPIPESDIPKSLPKPNIPYPSRRDDQKSRDKASNQMEKIFQIFQDLRFDISFADALLLMPRFAPTIPHFYSGTRCSEDFA